MTLAAERARLGREPISWVEIDADTCTRVYGTAPCTAAVGVTGQRKCYNTRKTCQDVAAFNRATSTYRFSALVTTWASPLVPSIPCLLSVQPTAGRIDPKGLGTRGTVTVQMQDFATADREDPYPTSRPWGTHAAGTWWVRFLARQPYLEGRSLRLVTGYAAPGGGYDATNMQVQAYVIDRITGPDASGTVSITARDPLALTDNDKSQFPAPTGAALRDAINAVQTTAILRDGNGAKLPSSGSLIIGKEIMSFTRTGDALTVARAQQGTTAATAAAGAAVQAVTGFTAAPIANVLGILLNAAGIPDTQLDLAGWATECDRWLPGNTLTVILTKPAGIKSLIAEVCEQGQVAIWWDTRAQLVRLRALRPALRDEVTDLTDTAHLLAGSVQVTTDPTQRVSAVAVYFDLLGPNEDPTKPASYRQAYVQADIEAGDPDGLQYRSERTRTILARWLGSAEATQAETLAVRTLLLYRDPPRTINFKLDAKDSALWTGHAVTITTRQITDDTGAPLPVVALLTEAKETTDGTEFSYQASGIGVTTRYAIITDDAAPDYTAASPAERDPGGYISTDVADSRMSNGDEPYRIY
jgi:hypothetical protein